MSNADTDLAVHSARASRLKAARIDAGFRTAREAAERLQIPYPTYAGHENGSRGIKDGELLLYSEAFKTSVTWIAFGIQATVNKALLPSVAFFDTIKPMDDLANGLEGFIEVEAPFPIPSGVSVVRIPDDHLSPTYFKNELLLIQSAGTLSGCIAKRCLIILEKQNSAGPERVSVAGTILRVTTAGQGDVQEITGRVHFEARILWAAEVVGIVANQAA